MSSKQLPVFIFIFILSSPAASAQCLTGNDNPTTSNQDARNSLIDGRFGFALESLKIVSEINTQDNIFFSPHSLYEALALVLFGARGSTETALKRALRIPDDLSKIDIQRFHASEKNLDDINKQSDNSSASLEETVGIEYAVANRLWVKNTTRLRECMSSLFEQELEKVDFRSNPEAVRIRINQWVSNITKGNIQDLIPHPGISQDTDLVLTNAVYFKGSWKSRFNPNNTKKSIFYKTPNNATLANFMYQKDTFNHMVSEELGAHVLQLPYKGDEVSMFIFLPPFANAAGGSQSSDGGRDDSRKGVVDDIKDTGLIHLIKRISSTERGLKELREILDGGMQPKSVQVQIPKFSLEQELPILQLAEALGIDELLRPGDADLRGFVDENEESLHIGEAVHHAKIDVNEDGTTAAAATALFSFRSSRPAGPAIFHANHPFMYLIYHHPTRSILFNGIFRKPAKADGVIPASSM